MGKTAGIAVIHMSILLPLQGHLQQRGGVPALLYCPSRGPFCLLQGPQLPPGALLLPLMRPTSAPSGTLLCHLWDRHDCPHELSLPRQQVLPCLCGAAAAREADTGPLSAPPGLCLPLTRRLGLPRSRWMPRESHFAPAGPAACLPTSQLLQPRPLASSLRSCPGLHPVSFRLQCTAISP